jgi:predicted DNA-binding transcriptional regulator AlpA
MTRKILRLEDIADRTGLPLATLRWYRHRGEGPPTFRLGRRVVGYEDEVDAWVAEQHRRGVTGGGSPRTA